MNCNVVLVACDLDEQAKGEGYEESKLVNKKGRLYGM
jgi:hypothetical protein